MYQICTSCLWTSCHKDGKKEWGKDSHEIKETLQLEGQEAYKMLYQDKNQ